MKTIHSFAKSGGADALKGPRSSQLRLENLEDRRLLSVADLVVLDAASAAESVQYAPAAPGSDALVDVESMLGSAVMDPSAGLPLAGDPYNAALIVSSYNAFVYNVDYDVPVAEVTVHDLPYAELTTDNAGFSVYPSTYDSLSGAEVFFIGGVDSVFPAGTYTVTVTASGQGVTLQKSFDVVVHQWRLEPPSNVQATAATADSITLSWNFDQFAAGHYVSVDGGPFEWFAATGLPTTHTITGLASNTEHQFRIYSAGDNLGDSDVVAYTASTLPDQTLTVTPLGGVLYNTDSNVAVADVATSGFNAPTITVDKPEFDIVGNQVVFVGGASGTYTLTVTASEEEVARTQTFDVVVNQAQLAAPANLRTTSVTTDSITFAWDAVPHANRYEFYLSESLYYNPVVFDTTVTTFYTATGLDSNTGYVFVVCAFGDDMICSEPSDCSGVFTLPNHDLTVTPLDVVLFNTAVNVAVADVVTTDFNYPTITVDNSAFAIIENQVVYLGNAPSGTYTLTVTAREGTVALTKTFNVVLYEEQLSAPANLRATAVTSDSITLAWDAVPLANKYAVNLRHGDGAWTVFTNSHTVTGLASNTEYAFLVRAANDFMFDSDAADVTVRTLAEAWATLSTDSPVFGNTVVVGIAPDSTATYAWYSVDADNVETPLGSAVSEYLIADADLLGKRLKAVVTYASGEFAGQVVSVTTANAVVRETALDVTISQVVPYVGAELTARRTTPGATAAYQWYRVGDGGEEAIADATLPSYTVTAADVGFYLKVVATGTGDYFGSASATTTVLAIAENPLTLSTLDPHYGFRITSLLNPGDSCAAYQWQTLDESTGEWVDINGAVYSYFTPGYSYIGKYLRATATYQRFAYAGLSASVAMNRVTRKVASITISGDADLTVGSELTTAVVYKYATVDYQWYCGETADGDAWTAIEGATASTYVISDADKGYYLKVVATGTGAYSGSVEAVTAAPAQSEPASVECLSFVTGATPQLGDRVRTALNPVDSFATYTWSLVDGQGAATLIPNATASYWSPSANQVGYKLRVTATYQRGAFAGRSFTLDTDVVTRDISQAPLNISPASEQFVGGTISVYLVPTYATLTYEWYRVDANDTETLIDGAAGSRYTTTGADAGFRIKVVATGVHPYVGTASAITGYAIAALGADSELDEDVFDQLALALLDGALA